jgi:hypothetical protein
VAREEVEKEKHEMIDIHSRFILAQMCALSAERRWMSLLLHVGDGQSLQVGIMRAQDCAWLGGGHGCHASASYHRAAVLLQCGEDLRHGVGERRLFFT